MKLEEYLRERCSTVLPHTGHDEREEPPLRPPPAVPVRRPPPPVFPGKLPLAAALSLESATPFVLSAPAETVLPPVS